MNSSPYNNKDVSEWSKVTEKLISKHPLKTAEIVDTVLKSWDDIFNSKIGSFFIGKEIFPAPQIMSFFLHELIAHYLGLLYPEQYKIGSEKKEKDVHCIINESLSVEIKASSDPRKIFANRSFAQKNSDREKKNKNGYYITVNFEKFKDVENRRPEILLIRFGYLEHTDWTAQKAATGQQASLSNNAYQHKLKVLYSRN